MAKLKKHPPAATTEQVLKEAAQCFFTLMRKSFALFQGVAAGQDLSPLQAKILLFMDPARPCAMREIAELAGCEPSHITGVVDKLEARKLLKRGAIKGDRRVKQVSITKPGIQIRDRLSLGLSEPAPWMRSLSSKDLRQLRDILGKGMAYDSLP